MVQHRGRGRLPPSISLSRIRTTAAFLSLTAALAVAAPAAAAVPARLQGTFAMAGTVTRAAHIRGERAGDKVRRPWSFSSTCPSGPCPTVTLHRARGTGATDTLTLTQTGPGTYAGSGTFTIPVLCDGAVVPTGGVVPFRISVRVAAARDLGGTAYATAINANYDNPRRINHSGCPGPLGSDAARYSGALQTALGAGIRWTGGRSRPT